MIVRGVSRVSCLKVTLWRVTIFYSVANVTPVPDPHKHASRLGLKSDQEFIFHLSAATNFLEARKNMPATATSGIRYNITCPSPTV